MKKTPDLFPTGGRTAISSGHILQNLSFTTSSFDWPSWTLLFYTCVRGRSTSRTLVAFHIVSCVRFRYCSPSISDGISFQIVWRHFSPEMHKNFHVGVSKQACSPWISDHYWWWASMWATDKASQVCWMWPRFCSGRSFSVVNRPPTSQRSLHRSHHIVLWSQSCKMLTSSIKPSLNENDGQRWWCSVWVLTG